MASFSRSAHAQENSRDHNAEQSFDKPHAAHPPNTHSEVAEGGTDGSNAAVLPSANATNTISQNWLHISKFLQEQFTNDTLEEFVG